MNLPRGFALLAFPLLALLAFVTGAVTQSATAAPAAQTVSYHDGCPPLVAMPAGPSGSAGWRLLLPKTGLYDGAAAFKCIYVSPEYNENPPPDDAYLNGCAPFVAAGPDRWLLHVVKTGQRDRETVLKCIYTRTV